MSIVGVTSRKSLLSNGLTFDALCVRSSARFVWWCCVLLQLLWAGGDDAIPLCVPLPRYECFAFAIRANFPKKAFHSLCISIVRWMLCAIYIFRKCSCKIRCQQKRQNCRADEIRLNKNSSTHWWRKISVFFTHDDFAFACRWIRAHTTRAEPFSFRLMHVVRRYGDCVLASVSTTVASPTEQLNGAGAVCISHTFGNPNQFSFFYTSTSTAHRQHHPSYGLLSLI